MSTILNWERFQNGPVGPEKAFEAFTAQIFERWIKNTYGPLHLASYVIRGDGGDGGVEAFAHILNYGVVGLQAKWFPQNLDASKIKQIKNSIAAATKTFGDLRQYIIAMPQNLTKGTPGKNGKLRNGGVERWGDLITSVKKAHPNLDIVRWDNDAFLEQLTAPGNHELKPLWFSGEFPFGTIETAWQKTRSRLRSRYIPELHAVGAIDSLLEADSWSLLAQKRFSAELKRAQMVISGAISSMEGFSLLTQNRLSTELRTALDEADSMLLSLRNHGILLEQILASGPRRSIPECPLTHALTRLSALLEDFQGSWPRKIHSVSR